MKIHRAIVVLAAAAVASLALPAPAAQAAPLTVDVAFGATSAEWQPGTEVGSVRLRVAGPAGIFEREFPAGQNPVFDLREMAAADDGLYTWELVAAPRLSDEVRQGLAEARAAGDLAAQDRLRDAGGLPAPEDLVLSGHFQVVGGAILQPGGETEATPAVRRVAREAGGVTRIAAADQVIPDDLIVQGSVCVGLDCVNNENFGFDTIRMKENNTRIDFTDTSTQSGFPSQDWEIAANDSASGGRNALIVSDEGNQIFVIESGNVSNVLYLEDGGRVGLRTSNPVLDLHISTSNTPGIRLEQTNAGGFTAQTWDIAGNEANFFVRDVTGGSLLPLRIRPGAPTSSLDISGDGDVGIGTASPDRQLHVIDSGAADNTVLEVENNGPARIRINNGGTGEVWNLGHQTPSGTGLVLSDVGDAVSEMLLDVSGNMTIAGTLTTGSATVYPDYVFAEGYELMPLDQLASFVATSRHLPGVPTADDVARAGGINMSELQVVLLEKVEELTLYTLQQHEVIAGLAGENAELKARLEAIEAKLQP